MLIWGTSGTRTNVFWWHNLQLLWPLSKLRIVSHYVISLKIHCKVNQMPIFYNTVKNYKKRNMHGLVKIYGYFQSLKLLGFQRPRLSYIYKERIKQLAWPSRKYPVHNLSSILHRLDRHIQITNTGWYASFRIQIQVELQYYEVPTIFHCA